MPRVADYSIVTDSWVLEKDQTTIKFEVPDNIVADNRAILGFMLHIDSLGVMKLKIKLNGTQVWDWKFVDETYVRFIQEVIPAGLLKPGTNSFAFHGSHVSGEGTRMVRVSDVVVWWQAQI